MPEPKRGRAHDAEGAREAILNAAEVVFAEHGFDGARTAAIATAAGYNSSLIFQYFGDKLGLYAQVVKRADQEMNELQALVISPLLEDESIAANAHAFKAFLTIIATAIFDYLAAHPRFIRMLLWEQAEGWKTYAKIISQFETEDADQIEALLRKAHSAGLLRSAFVPLIQLTMILQICLSYLTFVPLYQLVRPPDEDLLSPAALAQAREYVVAFVVHGMMIDSAETKR